MFRSFLPFLLASLGFILVGFTINMPLFEWEISEIVTDSPWAINFNPSPWIAKFGDALEDGSYISYQFYVSYAECRFENLNSVVRRSRNDEALDRIALYISQNIIPWLSEGTAFRVLLLLCGIYFWWFTIWYKRPTAEAFIFTWAAAVLFAVLINFWRLAFRRIGSLGCFEGTVTFDARLSKVYYETLLVLLAAILAEAGALGIMLRQIIKAVMEIKASSKSAVDETQATGQRD